MKSGRFSEEWQKGMEVVCRGSKILNRRILPEGEKGDKFICWLTSYDKFSIVLG